MKHQKYPYFTIVISVLTVCYSLYVNFQISGSFFGKIQYTQLEPYGGVTFGYIWNLELWRLFVSQLVHLKPPHMFFNVLSILLLGSILEKHIGWPRFFILWFVSGVCGTLVSTLTVEPPWNLGTGASQAVMGVAALGALAIWKKANTTFILKFSVGFAVLPALLIDLIYAHHPKLGHVTGFFVGFMMGLYFMNSGRQTHN